MSTPLKIVIEEDDTNFGHVNLIWEGDVNFPHIQNNSISGTSSSKLLEEPYFKLLEKPYFNKQGEIQRNLDNGTLNPVKDQQKYFKLFRYGINKLNKPNDNDGPTLSISLFMPNSNLIKRDFSQWSIKYFQHQVKLCVVFNYYFPNGNYRNYFDYYMLNTFKSLAGNDESLILTKQIDKFDYNDFDKYSDDVVNHMLQQYYDLLKTYENFPFNNGLERFIFTFDLACKCYNNNHTLEIREKTGDFFVYKFSGPFIENEGKIEEGHITDAYIGQHVRYISLKQTNYNYNGIKIKKPYHHVWRDAHSNCHAYNDYLWIKQINTYKNKTIYFLPNSLGYMPSWHDYVKCGINNHMYRRSAIAGVVQMINPKFSVDNNLYLKTIGLPFIINKDKLPIKETRKIDGRGNSGYAYGIDEYVLSSLFINDKIKKYAIYFNYNLDRDTYLFYQNIYYDDDSKDYNYYLQTAYIFILNKLKISKFKRLNVIRMVEKLRISNNSNDKALGFLLSIIPNKYQIKGTIFSYDKGNQFWKEKNNVDKITKDYARENPEIIEKLKNINFENLNYFGFKCRDNVIFNSTLEWCQAAYSDQVPYIGQAPKDFLDTKEEYLEDYWYCTPANFYSGFYDEKPPSLNIGILRQPSDLKYAIYALENNNLKLKLNKSDYKLYVESTTFVYAVRENIDNYYNHIKSAIQNIILKFGNINKSGISKAEMIARKVSLLLNPTDIRKTQSDLWAPLIWKALNYSGYDVPPQWFKIDLDNDEYYYKFNEFVKELANIPGWADYAVEVLISDNDSYTNTDNDFNSDKVISKSNEYKTSYVGKDFNKYKMASYIKYLKYKNKYLKLKNIN